MMRLIHSFFSEKEIGVEFRNVGSHVVDQSLFDQALFQQISSDQHFHCSPARLLLSASIHFRGRFRRNRAFQVANVCFEVMPSLWRTISHPRLVIGGFESNEFQAKSSEVIAIGIGISLAKKLLGIGYADITLIEGTQKRCDFEFLKNGLLYQMETRGRKSDKQIKAAINGVFQKKAASTAPNSKYGFVSHLPRDGTPCSVVVVDPPTEPKIPQEWELVVRRLRYYSRASRAAGFWRLSDLLLERATLIAEYQDSERFNGEAIQYGNAYKIGRGIEMRSRDMNSTFFIPEGIEESFFFPLFPKLNYVLTLGLDSALLDILEQQDYEKMLNLSFKDSSSEGDIKQDDYSQ